jgi:hypothetical protein
LQVKPWTWIGYSRYSPYLQRRISLCRSMLGNWTNLMDGRMRGVENKESWYFIFGGGLVGFTDWIIVRFGSISKSGRKRNSCPMRHTSLIIFILANKAIFVTTRLTSAAEKPKLLRAFVQGSSFNIAPLPVLRSSLLIISASLPPSMSTKIALRFYRKR